MKKIAVNVVPTIGTAEVSVKKNYEIVKIHIDKDCFTVYRDENGNYYLLPESTRLLVKSTPTKSYENITIREKKYTMTLTRFDTGQYSLSYLVTQ